MIRRFANAALATGPLWGLLVGLSVAQAADAPRIAIFPFEINDTSGEVRDLTQEQAARLTMVTDEVSSMLAERGATIVDVSMHKPALATMPELWQCDGCEAPLAREESAEIAITGMVHKMSTLVQSIALVARDVDSGKIIGDASVSIRGDTDRAWRRGVRYIVKRDLLGPKVHANLRHIDE